MDTEKIKKAFKDCGIKKGDTIVLHGDAGIAAQIKSNTKDKVSYFFDILIDFVGKNGNILIPTFTYSSCKKNYFDKENNKSEVGLFSESFRNRKNIKRTDHPIFSFAIFGKKFKHFNTASIETCFGNDSIFQFLHNLNAKIICLGCDLERVTFTHYVEEFYKVDYRFNKVFNIYCKNKKKSILTNYYVRKLNEKSTIDLSKLNKYLKKKNKIKESTFGRYNLILIKAKDFFISCTELLNKNKNSLIKKN